MASTIDVLDPFHDGLTNQLPRQNYQLIDKLPQYLETILIKISISFLIKRMKLKLKLQEMQLILPSLRSSIHTVHLHSTPKI